MDHHDHVRLLSGAVQPGAATWADLGSGSGAFTLALADLLGPGGIIYSVDRDRDALRVQQRTLASGFPRTVTHYLAQDFMEPLPLPPLDGIVMANSLHFVRRKEPLLARLASNLRPGGQFVLVEYNTDAGNRWVPYPLSFETWQQLATQCGLNVTHKLAAVPSRFLGEIYSAQSMKRKIDQP